MPNSFFHCANFDGSESGKTSTPISKKRSSGYGKLRKSCVVTLLVLFSFRAIYVSPVSVPLPTAAAQELPPAEKPKQQNIQSIHWEAEATAFALNDLPSYIEEDRPFVRYLLVRDGRWQPFSLCLNLVINRQPDVVPTEVFLEGHIIRVNLRRYAESDKTLADLVKTWEELRFDPYFSQVAKVVVGKVVEGVTFEVIVESTPLTGDARVVISSPKRGEIVSFTGKSQDGYHRVTYKGEMGWIKAKDVSKVAATPSSSLVNVRAFHAGGSPDFSGPANKLSELTKIAGLLDKGSEAVVTDSRYFAVRAFSSLDIGFGDGLYYRFRGVPRSDDPKKSDFELLMEQLNANLNAAKVGQGASAAALSMSGVTGRQRQIFVLRTLTQQPGRGQSLVWYTLDPAQDQKGADFDPFRNYAGIKFAASEVIFDLESGLHGYALYDFAGKLQLRAPDDVVTDHTIPKPFPHNLYSGRSCLSCHGPDDGILEFQNSAKTLLGTKIDEYGKRLDLIGDLRVADQKRAVNTFVRLYNWQPRDETAPSARRAFASAVTRCTKQESRASCAALIDAFDTYAYASVGVKDALMDLGIAYGSRSPVEVFRFAMLAKQPQDSAVFVTSADPILGLLIADERVTRHQWEDIYAEAATRAIASGIFNVNGAK